MQATEDNMTLQIERLSTITLPAIRGIQAGDLGVVAIRPEQIAVHALARQGEIPHAHPGKILDFLYVGDVITSIIELNSGIRVEALLANSSPGCARFFEVGDPVLVSWPQQAVRFLVDPP